MVQAAVEGEGAAVVGVARNRDEEEIGTMKGTVNDDMIGADKGAPMTLQRATPHKRHTCQFLVAILGGNQVAETEISGPVLLHPPATEALKTGSGHGDIRMNLIIGSTAEEEIQAGVVMQSPLKAERLQET